MAPLVPFANLIQFKSGSAPMRGRGGGGLNPRLKAEHIIPPGVALESVHAVIPREYAVAELPMLPIPWGPRGEALFKISAFYALERRFFREGVPQ